MTDSLHVVCPQCLGINRVPKVRLGDDPSCGKCGETLFTGRPLELNQQTFAKHLRGDLPLVVDFWAPWCGPCKMMAPVFSQAASEQQPQVRLAKVNTEENQPLAMQYNIRTIPTLVAFKNSQEVARVSGALNREQLNSWIAQNC